MSYYYMIALLSFIMIFETCNIFLVPFFDLIIIIVTVLIDIKTVTVEYSVMYASACVLVYLAQNMSKL